MTSSRGSTRTPCARRRCATHERTSNMSSTDVLMIIGCLVIGYGLVSMVLRKPGPPPAAPKPPPFAPAFDAPAPPRPPAPPHWSSVLEIARDANADEIR